jgi:hypothetical protein
VRKAQVAGREEFMRGYQLREVMRVGEKHEKVGVNGREVEEEEEKLPLRIASGCGISYRATEHCGLVRAVLLGDDEEEEEEEDEEELKRVKKQSPSGEREIPFGCDGREGERREKLLLLLLLLFSLFSACSMVFFCS